MSGAGTVEIGNGTWNFNAGTYSVAGTTVLSGGNGTANFNAAASTNALALTGGFLLGSGIVSVSGDLTWMGHDGRDGSDERGREWLDNQRGRWVEPDAE